MTKPVNESNLTEGVLDDMDDDGFMAKRQLYDIAKYAVALHKIIQDTDNLEPWISAKITTAADYIDTVKHYLEYQGVANADDMAHDVGMENIADMVDTVEIVGAQTEELMADVDMDVEPALDGYDVLRMAKARGIISASQHDDPDQNLLDLASRMAEMLEPGDIAGSSDVSILMKELVSTAKAELVLLMGSKVDAYYSMVEAKRIYEKMMSGIKGKKMKKVVRESTSSVINYLLTDGKGNYDLFEYDAVPGTNPRHLSKEIDKQAAKLGWQRATVEVQWKGDIDEVIAEHDRIAAAHESTKNNNPQQYYGNVNAAEKLRKAKEVLNTTTVDEARNPMGAINKFLANKDAAEERSAELARDPSKTTQATKMPVKETRKRK
jgi:hypothetical protein